MDLSNSVPLSDAQALAADDIPTESPAVARRRRRLKWSALLVGAAVAGLVKLALDRERLPRVDAIRALVETSEQVERYFAQCAGYPHDLATLHGWVVESRCDIALSDAGDPLVADERYVLRLESPRAAGAGRDSYLLTAEPVGEQVRDGCGAFTFDEQGRQSNVGASLPQRTCWRR